MHIQSPKVIGLLVLDKVFKRVLPYMSMVAILVIVPGLPASKHSALVYTLSSIGPVVLEEQMFENGRRKDVGRRSHWYTISSPMSLRLR